METDIPQSFELTQVKNPHDILNVLGEKALQAYLADIFTLPASLAGLPGMSLPVGFGEAGMPVGLQLIGNHLQEARLLSAAHAYQQATDWHIRRPGDAT